MRLSIITASRNDGHGGDIIGRMNLMIENLDYNNKRMPIDVELVIVEWNPMPDWPHLANILTWPESYPIRIITVPPEVHQRVANSNQIHFFQMIAKNVGIRRAHGEMILCTNCDVLFSEALWKELSKWSGLHHEDFLFRADRIDVSAPKEKMDPGSLLEWCEDNWQIRYGECGVEARDGSKVNPERANCNACGDFQMAQKSVWMDMGGYPEIPLYSWHLDSVFEYGCLMNDIEEASFNRSECLYHIMHGYGQENITLQKELEQKRTLCISDAKLNEIIGMMYRSGRYCIVNYKHWGYATDIFPETVLRKEQS